MQNCNCNRPCHEVIYDVSTSLVRWPQKSTVPNFIKTYVKNSKNWVMQYILNQVENYYRQANNTKYESTRNISLETFLRVIASGTHDLSNASIFQEFLQMETPVTIDNRLTKQNNFDEAMEYWVQNYFYRLNIYFKQGSVEKHQQVVAFSFIDLCSAFGGIAGLWFGASLLSVIEIWYLAFVSITVACKYCKAKREKHNVTAEQHPQ